MMENHADIHNTQKIWERILIQVRWILCTHFKQTQTWPFHALQCCCFKYPGGQPNSVQCVLTYHKYTNLRVRSLMYIACLSEAVPRDRTSKTVKHFDSKEWRIQELDLRNEDKYSSVAPPPPGSPAGSKPFVADFCYFRARHSSYLDSIILSHAVPQRGLFTNPVNPPYCQGSLFSVTATSQYTR